ncbi:MAG TPA: preprotein translocase subunit SecG [Thermoguttaceae bacterium]|nr:preprotein translocase subunit SecG [Thermoguttaceae bacterium]
MEIVFKVLLIVTALFLILIILVQKGKGGGLAGAFGGMGGQSAFGTKAGDLFTKITIGVAAFWIVLCLMSVGFLKTESRLTGGGTAPGASGQQSSSGTGQSSDTGNSAPVEQDKS